MCYTKKCNLKCLIGGCGTTTTAAGTGCQKLKLLFSISYSVLLVPTALVSFYFLSSSLPPFIYIYIYWRILALRASRGGV
jgi:hypothetical protein